MQDYRQYKPTDFIADASFRAWVLEDAVADKVFWEEWMLLNPDKRAEILESKNILLSVNKALNHIDDDEITEEILRLNETLDHRESKKNTWNGFTWNSLFYAAASIFVLLALFWFNRKSDTATDNMAYVEQSTQKWLTQENTSIQQMAINLADGSTVILQKNSKIMYPATFESDKREVVLVGEAFFEVTKNPQQPFYVFANKLVTKVLGTSFSIKANANDEQVKVIVKTGKVAVFENTAHNLNQEQQQKKLEGLVLTPNEQVVFDQHSKQMVRSVVKEANQLTMPIQQQVFEFDKTPIAKVFKTLEETYGIQIEFNAETMKNCYLTAYLSDEPLVEKLDLICKTIDAKYERKDKSILVYSQGCY